MNFLEKPLVLFLKEHLMPTLISFVIAIAVYLLIPRDNWVLIKIGDDWFKLFIFSVCFILIQFLLYIKEKINVHRSYKKYVRSKKQRGAEEYEKYIEDYRKYADRLSYEDRDFIRDCIKNENEPIVIKIRNPYSNSIYGSSNVLKTRNQNGQEVVRLTDTAYRIFTEIYYRYHKIGHFD